MDLDWMQATDIDSETEIGTCRNHENLFVPFCVPRGVTRFSSDGINNPCKGTNKADRGGSLRNFEHIPSKDARKSAFLGRAQQKRHVYLKRCTKVQ